MGKRDNIVGERSQSHGKSGKTLLILPAAAMGWMSEAKSIPRKEWSSHFFHYLRRKNKEYGENKTILPRTDRATI